MFGVLAPDFNGHNFVKQKENLQQLHGKPPMLTQ